MKNPVSQATETQDQHPNNNELVIDLAVLAKYFWHRKRILITAALIGGVIAATLSLTKPNIYESQVLLAPAQHETSGLASIAGQFGGLASLAGIDIGESDQLATEGLALLTSRKFVLDFIRDFNLKPALFPEKWDDTNKQWSKPGALDRLLKAARSIFSKTAEKQLYSDPNEPSDWDTYLLFTDNFISVRKDKKTNLITVITKAHSPEDAKLWADELVRRANEHLRSAKKNEAEKSIAYLEKNLQKTSIVEMQKAMYQLIEAQTKTVMIANSKEEFAFKIIDPAYYPERKAGPKRTIITLAGILLGGLAAALSLLIHHLRQLPNHQASKSTD